MEEERPDRRRIRVGTVQRPTSRRELARQLRRQYREADAMVMAWAEPTCRELRSVFADLNTLGRRMVSELRLDDEALANALHAHTLIRDARGKMIAAAFPAEKPRESDAGPAPTVSVRRSRAPGGAP